MRGMEAPGAINFTHLHTVSIDLFQGAGHVKFCRQVVQSKMLMTSLWNQAQQCASRHGTARRDAQGVQSYAHNCQVLMSQRTEDVSRMQRKYRFGTRRKHGFERHRGFDDGGQGLRFLGFHVQGLSLLGFPGFNKSTGGSRFPELPQLVAFPQGSKVNFSHRFRFFLVSS